METNKHLFRSQLNNSIIVSFLVGTAIGIFGFHLPPFGIPVWLLFLFGILFNYLVFAFSLSRYYFYNDQFVRIFLLRPFLRKTYFKYEQIFKIKYTRIWYPEFIVFRKRKQFFPNFNNFLFNKHTKRVEIVEFLLSKNVKIEVRSPSEKKDKEIIDLVKKKYPKNIHLYP